MMIDTAGDLISSLPVAGRDQVIDSWASREIGLGEVLEQFLAEGIEMVLRDDITGEGDIAVERVRYRLAGAGKVSTQHLHGGDQSLQNVSSAAAPPFVV